MGLRGPGAKPKAKRGPAGNSHQLAPPSGASRFERVVNFIEQLPITSGLLAGTMFKVQPWQRQILKGIYRTDRKGRRIVRQVLITTPRKNGKTGLTSALALAHLCGPEAEERGQVYSAAADRNQAALMFNEMKAIIERVPALEKRIVVRDFNKHLEDIETGSIYQAVSADARTKHGFSASCWIYDELAQAPDRKLYDVLATSTAARKEPLGIVISTQSSDPHSVMSELVNYGLQVRDRVLEDKHFLPVIFTAPEDADPWSEATWRRCNPALAGGFKSIEEMRVMALQAQRIPAREPAFRLLHLNQRVRGESRFIPPAEWEACAGVIDIEALRGQPCWAGLDLGSTTDLTSLALYFPEDGSVLPYFWVPRDRLEERERSDSVPYPLWERKGLIEAPEGRAINRLAIVRRLAEIASMFDVKGLAYDRWRLEDLKKLLEDEGIDLPLVPFGQGFQSMGPAVDALETAILNRELKHANHPTLTWNCWNRVVEIDPTGARKITKAKSTERVDGMVALAMAIGLHARAPKPRRFEVPESLVITA